MKITNYLRLACISSLALVSCTKGLDENSEWNDGKQPITFKTSISRVVDNAWEANDEVGIFMKSNNGNLSDAIYKNMNYLSDKDGNLSAKDKDNFMYFPIDGSEVKFIAYYPYNSTLTDNKINIDVTNQSKPSNLDLLYSTNEDSYSSTSNAPALPFKHQLSNIILNISHDATISSLEGLKITFQNMNTKASFNLEDGTLSDVGTPANIEANYDSNNSVASAIVLPAASTADVKVVFELGGNTFTASYPQSTLNNGEKYTHTVSLGINNGRPVISFGNAIINDWIKVTGDNMDVKFDEGETRSNLFETTFADDFGNFTTEDKNLGDLTSTPWSIDKSYHYLKVTGYASSKTNAVESWLVSPEIDITTVTAPILTFDHTINKLNSGSMTEICTLKAQISGDDTWEDITIPTYPSGANWTMVSSGDIDLSKYVGKKIKIAFVYKSTSESAPTWEIKNFKITAVGASDDSSSDSSTTGNLVKNGDFESWSKTLPDNWDNETYNVSVEKSTDFVHNGNNAVKITAATKNGKLQQEVAIEGKKTYKISYWFYDNGEGQARLWSYWLNSTNKTIADTNTDDIFHLGTNDSYSSNSDKWQHFEKTVTAPEDAVKFRFEVRVYKEQNTAGDYCYFDDFEITEVK